MAFPQTHMRSDLDGRTDQGHTTTGGLQGTKKVSLGDKLNPFKDADGDGKKGFMD